jgi:hypothetical protein
MIFCDSRIETNVKPLSDSVKFPGTENLKCGAERGSEVSGKANPQETGSIAQVKACISKFARRRARGIE